MKTYKLHYGYNCCQPLGKEDYPFFSKLLNENPQQSFGSFQSIFLGKLHIMPVSEMDCRWIITEGFSIDRYQFILNEFDNRYYLVFRLKPDDADLAVPPMRKRPLYHYYRRHISCKSLDGRNDYKVHKDKRYDSTICNRMVSLKKPKEVFDDYTVRLDCTVLELCEISRS